MSRSAWYAAFVAGLMSAGAGQSRAGSLTPPPGPPAPSMKPLDQVDSAIPITSLPYTISASGRYKITLDLTLPGISVTTTPTDYRVNKQFQMVQFDGQRWQKLGDIVTDEAKD